MAKLVRESSVFGCPPRTKNLLYDNPKANATYSFSSSSKVQAGSDSVSGRRNFSSGLPTENTRMNPSKKDPSAPGNEKPPRADKECECLRRGIMFMNFVDGWLYWIATACFGYTIYSTVKINRDRSKLSKYLDSLPKSSDE